MRPDSMAILPWEPGRWLCRGREEVGRALAFVVKDMRIAASYRLQFVFQFSQVFFSVAVIYFIGRMMESAGAPAVLQVYGADYFSFALVGLAMNSYLKTGVVVVTNNIRQMMNQGTLEAVCAGPVGYTRLLFYMMLWPFVFETFRIGLYFLFGILLFGLRLEHANWMVAIITAALTIPTFVMLGIVSSSLLILVKRGDPVNWFFSSVSGLLAGTMFPVAVLPAWLRLVAFCLPLTHSLEALRRSLLAGATFREVQGHLLALALFATVLLPITVVMNHICLARAKRTGAFFTY
jgi:ABC-2 type transport system permease protein